MPTFDSIQPPNYGSDGCNWYLASISIFVKKKKIPSLLLLMNWATFSISLLSFWISFFCDWSDPILGYNFIEVSVFFLLICRNSLYICMSFIFFFLYTKQLCWGIIDTINFIGFWHLENNVLFQMVMFFMLSFEYKFWVFM